jgi:hypothetical protein
MTRPICINHGCGKPVTYSHKDELGNPRWRIHCGHCQGASYGKTPHASGVTPWKQGKCSNHDSHLGFPCAIDYSKAPWAVGMTEVDHKDGDHTNNSYDNLDELCSLCHKRKGQLSGDYNNQKNKVNKKRTFKGNSTLKKLEAFNTLFRYVQSDNDEVTHDKITHESTKRIA